MMSQIGSSARACRSPGAPWRSDTSVPIRSAMLTYSGLNLMRKLNRAGRIGLGAPAPDAAEPQPRSDGVRLDHNGHCADRESSPERATLLCPDLRAPRV